MLEGFFDSIYHNAYDFPLSLLSLLFCIGAVYGYLSYTSETDDSELKTPYKKFTKSCVVSIGWAILYTMTYSNFENSKFNIILIINYFHAFINIIRFIYCVYVTNKIAKEKDEFADKIRNDNNKGL